MPQASARLAALLEIGRRPNGEIPVSLISAAYRASRSTAIMLVLDSISPAEIDHVLDPVVAQSGHDLSGVLYVSKHDDAAVLRGAEGASSVFASSDELCAKLLGRGIAFRDVSEAERLFANA